MEDQATSGRAKRRRTAADPALCLLQKPELPRFSLVDTTDLHAFILQHLADLPNEHFLVIATDDELQTLGSITHPGELRSVCVRPRQIAAFALPLNATKILLAHNHPDSLCCPDFSEQDLRSHYRLQEILGWYELTLVESFLVAGRAVKSITESAVASGSMPVGLLHGSDRERLQDVSSCLAAAYPLVVKSNCKKAELVLLKHALCIAEGVPLS